eukprot:scaffold44907_cov64-Phaeocystis_antarctica.AAC.4
MGTGTEKLQVWERTFVASQALLRSMRLGRTGARYATEPGFATKYEMVTPGLGTSVEARAKR